MNKIKNTKLYEEKNEDYFSAARKDIIDLLPVFSERVLEIGCGSGQTLELIKHHKRCGKTVGIELFEQAAKNAQTRVDEVYNLDIEKDELPFNLGQFDLIIILDVLEHLVDPWGLLNRIKSIFLKPGGKMIISLPNARHFTCVMPLLISGDFNYSERGVLDKTHLRFFTRKSGTRMLNDAELAIERVKCTGLEWSLNSGKLNALTLGIFSEFLTIQCIYLVNADQAQGNSQ